MGFPLTFFQFCGDMAHVASFSFLLYRLHKSKSAAGISLKTMELYFVVFCARYIDVLPFVSRHHNYHSWFLEVYLPLMKFAYIGVSGAVVYLLRFREPFKTTYDTERDNFPHWMFLAAPCAVLGLVWNYGWSSTSWSAMFVEMLWAFSQFLEAVAIFPQSVLMKREKQVETITSNYVFCLGLYRVLYVLNWIYKLATREHYRDWISWTAGTIQIGLFTDFFYFYFKSRRAGYGGVILPA